MQRLAFISAIHLSAVVLLFAGAAAPVQAQQPAAGSDHLMAAASRVMEDADHVPAQTMVITADMIDRSVVSNVAEVLRTLAGIHISDFTGAERFYQVDMRGFGGSGSRQILMLIDGRPAQTPDASGPDWNLIPLERLERIEIVRGSRGVVFYGDQAAAGVINIVTKTGGPLGARAQVAYGSYDTKQVSGAVHQAGQRFSYEIGAGYGESQGYRDNAGILAKDIGGALHAGIGNKWRVHASAGFRGDEVGRPGLLPLDDLATDEDRTATLHPHDSSKLDDLFTQAALEVTILTNDLFKLEASYRERSTDTHLSADILAAQGGWSQTRLDWDSFGITPQLVFKEDFGGIANRLSMGYDLVQERRKAAIREATARYYSDSERRSGGFFVHDELTVANRWSLSGGYRLEQADYQFRQGPQGDKTIDEESWNGAIAYFFGNNARIYASFTRGFRMPLIDEFFDERGAAVNSALEAQTFDGYEVGLNTQIAPHLNLTVNAFQIMTDDEILEDPTDRSFDNRWDTRRRGVELMLDWNWKGVRLGGGYTWTEAEFEDGPYDGRQMPNVPEDRAFARIGYQFRGGLFLGLEGFYVGGRRLAGDWANTAAQLDDHLVLNAKIRYAYRWMTVFVELDNLLNETYASYGILSAEGQAGYFPAPEFAFLAGIRIGLGKS